MDTIKFWAKTTDDKDRYPNAYHPLICHMIDVAVVTKTIWEEVLPTATKNRIRTAFGVEYTGNLIAFIAGLHDLGKCSPPFTLRGIRDSDENQTKRLLQLYEETEFCQSSVKPAIDAPHGFVTAFELPHILANDFNFPSNLADDISKLIGGHHGIFPTSRKLNRIESKKLRGNEHWAKARKELAATLANTLNIAQSIEFSGERKLANAEIMILAGLVSVADWIGSNTEFFLCEIEDFQTTNFELDLDEYCLKSQKQAKEALISFGWVLNKTSRNKSKVQTATLDSSDKFRELFPFIEERRHLQDVAIEIGKELTDAGIVIVEAPTGEGKTEAAMYLADSWNRNLDQHGYYFALPTQATSNQMFGRVNNFLRNSFPNENVHNQLLHGHASLSAELKTLKENHKQFIKNISDDECVGDSCTPSVVAAEWFTYRKRGLLAPFGVGTIDQALLAVLQTKHVFVRLFGLANKTIIIDEVHAYDAYMSTLLERLLEWLAALKSPVILLSATLPSEKKNSLIKAYQKGLGINAETRTLVSVQTDQKDQYPRISYAVGEKIEVTKLNTSEHNRRTIYLEETDENFIEKLKDQLKDEGGCVAIICNTVARSQELFEVLSNDSFFQGNDEVDGLPKLDLLHSRFRFLDRDEIEKRTLIRFGKNGEKIQIKENGKEIEKEVKRPKFAVLISTQIIEQSLDLDFDLMITDLAPIDLLLQRAGRLQRHERKTRPKSFANKPTLWIIKSRIDEQENPDFGKSIYIYNEHILFRTWLKTKVLTEINVPADIEELIEFVYSDNKKCADGKYIKFWGNTKNEMNRKLEDKQRKAKGCLITNVSDSGLFENVILGLDEDNPDIHKSLQASTRDIETPSVSVIILKQSELSVVDLDSEPDRKAAEYLLVREAKISRWGLTNAIISDDELKPQTWKKSPHLRHYRRLVLDENNEIEIDKHRIKLDELLGICIEAKEEN